MNKQLSELLLQALETEQGGMLIYETALQCAVNPDLEQEWQKYLEETRNHVRVMEELCAKLDLDTAAQSPGRKVVHHLGTSLVKAMEIALAAGDKNAAELVACECVVLAETKDHQNWELITHYAKNGKGTVAQIKALEDASDEVEDQEDEHIYHTKGWCRELWIQSLGMSAVLPPPEEKKSVKTAIGASRAEQDRDSML